MASTASSVRTLLVGLALASFACCAMSQSTAAQQTPDAATQNRRLGAGVNVLGYDPIWRNPNQARFKEKHFGIIAEVGFTSIRVNLHPFRHMGPAPDYTLPEQWFKTADWIVSKAVAAKLAVILDMHEFQSLGKDAAGGKPRFLAFWKQFAEHFKDAPSDVMFEILNEPNGQLTPQLWNEYLAEALAIIRSTNPNRTVIIGPAFWNSVDHLDELKLPEADRNLIATVHYYKPMSFTHQGAAWANFKDKTGVPWTATPEEQAAVTRDFDKVQRWSKKNNRPILLGEFGAYDKADMPSRARYTSFVARKAEALDWSWAYWQFDSDFIVYDIKSDKWVEPIHRALVPEEAAKLSGFDSSADVGQINKPGSAEFVADGSTYRVTGSGANIWGTADAFHFVYRKLAGDVTFASSISFVGDGKNAHRKACLMVRQSLDADAAYADVAVHGDGLISLQYRSTRGGPTAEVASKLKAPARVQLQRKGDLFTLTITPKDQAAQEAGSVTVKLQDTVYAGLAVSSHDATVCETAVFAETAITRPTEK